MSYDSLILSEPGLVHYYPTGGAQLPAFNLGDGPLSVECWVKRSAPLATTQVVLSLDNGCELVLGTDNKVYLSKANVGGFANSSTAISDTTTAHHVVATKSGAASKVYVDGVDVTVAGANQTFANGFNANSWIGNDYGSIYPTSGVIDRVAFYSAVLSPAQVLSHATYPPSAVNILAATSITASSATLNGSVNPNGKPTTFHFEYGPTNTYGTSTPETSLGFTDNTVHNVSAAVTGLSSNSTYHFRLVATS